MKKPMGKMAAVVLFGFVGQSAAGSIIPTRSLIQYQYDVDVPACNVSISPAFHLEFSGVFANEKENIIFYEIVNLYFKTNKTYAMSKLVKIDSKLGVFVGKVVFSQPGKVVVAVDPTFLNVFQLSDGQFTVNNLGIDPYLLPIRLEPARDIRLIRSRIKRGQLCQEGAQAAD